MTAAVAMAAGAKGGPDNTVLYLLAAIVIAAMAFGYLIWRDWRRTRGHTRGHPGTYGDPRGTGEYDTERGDLS